MSNTAQKTNINTETSSEQPCSFKKGTCIKHNTPGTKYVVTKTKWKDRGMGKGFGNVYSRTVKYHCCGEGKTGPDNFQFTSETGRHQTFSGTAIVYNDDHLLKSEL